MYSLRKWLYKPKRTDSALLAQFYYADEELNMVAAELDSFDGRKDPERCTGLVIQLRSCQDKVLGVIHDVIDDAVPGQRASRDYRVKFPDEILQESLAGQLWFGAECLAAGSSIMNREVESASMRPLARALTKNLDSLRSLLQEQCLRNMNAYTERIKEALIIFDKLFAEFELSYVSAMVPVKTMRDFDMLQEITVLFSETLIRALSTKLLSQDMIDDYDPALMFTIPRLAIVCGLLIYREGPLNPDNDPSNMSEMFRPFQMLLYKIRELLYTLGKVELCTLEKALCSSEEPSITSSKTQNSDILSQTDPGFHDGPPTVSTVECMIGPILVHTPSSGSPVTPINGNEELDLSPGLISPATVIENLFEEFSYQRDVMSEGDYHDTSGSLNKSESKDSGLHSENISTSDTVIPDVWPVVLSDIGKHISRLSSSEDTGTLGASSADFDNWSFENEEMCSKSCCNIEGDSSVSVMCREIVNDIVDLADLAQNRSKHCCHYRRQPSCEYNLNFEIPRISVSDYLANGSENHTVSQKNFSESRSLSTDNSARQIDCEISVKNVDSSVLSTHDYDMPNLQNADAELNVDSNYQVDETVFPAQTYALAINHSNFDDKLQDDHSNINVKYRNDRDSSICSQIKTEETNRVKDNYRIESTGDRNCQIDKMPKKSRTSQNETDEVEVCLEIPRIQRLRYTESVPSSFSSCCSGSSIDSECERGECDRESCASSETCSYNSECRDDEEIILAIQAAELASRNETRSRFQSSGDLIHRLFVCISGVADQLQSNYAGDLRNILKSVFDMHCSEPLIEADTDGNKNLVPEANIPRSNSVGARRMGNTSSQSHRDRPNRQRNSNEPPTWIADDESQSCMSCRATFTLVRRRHHCRNCGKIFCGRCSANAVPLPQFGQIRAVRVCNRCFMFHVTPFTVNE